MSFTNLLFFLKNSNNTSQSKADCDNNYLNELENIFINSKSVIKNYKLKTLIEKGIEDHLYSTRENIISLMVSFIIEASCANYGLNCDELITNIFPSIGKFEINFNKKLTNTSVVHSLIKFIEEVLACLNVKITFKDEENKLSVCFYAEEGIQKKDSLKLIAIKSEEEFFFDESKIVFLKSPRKKTEN